MSLAHWSWCGHTVKILGVNATSGLAFLAWIVYPPFLGTLYIFFLTVAFFLIVENFLNMKPMYVLSGIRYWLMGTIKTPRTKDFDI